MTPRQTNDLDKLILRARDGDPAAFRQFYEITSPAINAFLLRLLKDRHLAEDVLQEAMVAAWHRLDEFDPSRAAAKTWITTIARHRALDLVRSQKRRDGILDSRTSEIGAVLGQQESSGPQPESDATASRLAYCFGRLKKEAAAAIRFAYLDGLTFTEISARIDRSANTIKSWVRRGLGQLKACMRT